MKTRLLRKIRRDFKIYLYPNMGIYTVIDIKAEKQDRMRLYFRKEFYNAEDAVEHVRYLVRVKYERYSRKYKKSLEKKQVWYNN